jgi:hypothetical protein
MERMLSSRKQSWTASSIRVVEGSDRMVPTMPILASDAPRCSTPATRSRREDKQLDRLSRDDDRLYFIFPMPDPVVPRSGFWTHVAPSG